MAHDRESIVLGAVVALGTLVLQRRRRHAVAAIVVGLVALDTALWLVPASFDNARHDDGFGAVTWPLLIASVAIATIGAAAMRIRASRRHASGRTARIGAVVTIGVILVVVASVAVAAATGDLATGRLPAGGLSISTRNMSFNATRLRVTVEQGSPTGTTVPAAALTAAGNEVTVALTNHDLFWHTFTIDGLDVNLRAPTGGRRQVSFVAAPGTYTFYCSIPGHRAAGMEGTLEVDAA